jgi:arylsulfatase A-like enzyme
MLSMTSRFGLFLLGTSLLGLAAPPAGAAQAPKPNIVFLLADDLGWSDVSYHGGEIKTPNLDQLAARGAKLEQFYVQPVCSPTRAALLTGRYPMRHGLQVGVVRPWAQYGLPLEEQTLAQGLKQAGYFTAICGKWHLGHFQKPYLPTPRGFDHQYGHYNGALDYFTHERDGGFDWHRNGETCRDEGYTTELIGNEAVRLIEHHDFKQPLFLYVPFNAPHTPLQARPEDLQLYEHIPNRTRRAYAAMVHCEDLQVGRIVAALEKRGVATHTLFIFSSDNGGPLGSGATNGRLRAGKGTLYEGGTRVAAFATWPGRIPAGAVIHEPLHIVDWYPTLLGLAGAEVKQKLPLDGRNIWPVLAEGARTPHADILLNTTPNNGAIRMGDWKLVLNGGRPDAADGISPVPAKRKGNRARPAGDENVELFNLAEDPYEQRNLAAQHPEKVNALRARLDAYARQAVPPKAAPKAADFVAPKVWGEFK